MAQPREKRSHPSDRWTVAEKRKSLEMMRFASRPHVRIFLPSSDKLPVIGYMTSEDFCQATKARVLNPPAFSDEKIDSSLADWAAAHNHFCPAIRFKINGSVREGEYVSKSPPEITFGLLNTEVVEEWLCIPNIQQLWLQTVWAMTGCEPDDWLPHMYKRLDGRPLKPVFTPFNDLTRILTQAHQIFVAIIFLNRFWRSKNYLARGVAHLMQLKIVKKLGENNFRNYLGEAGVRTMSDSQVIRHWRKLINGSAKLEKFRRDLKAKRGRDVQKFLQENARNPFISDVFNMLDR